MTHVPPYRALEALHAGRLRPSHRAVIEVHLAACEACRTALACVGAYDRISSEVRAVEPVVDWARVNEGVSRARRRSRDLRIAFVACGAIAMAASVFLVVSPALPPPMHATSDVAPVEQVTAPTLSGATGVAVIDDVPVSPHAIGDHAVHDGSVLRTAAGSIRVSLAPETRFTLGDATEVTLGSARPPIRLSLAGGRISSEVRPGTPYEIHAGAYVVRVKGTRFDVERSGDHVAVHLHSGRVEVVESGVSLGILVAPATWTSPDAAVTTPIALPVSEETHERPASRQRSGGRPAAASPTPAAQPFVEISSDEADVAASMRSQSGRLRQCITSDTQMVSFTLHLSVGTMGSITDVSLSSRSEIPTSLSDCILRTVQRFRVPAPDEPVDLSLPMTLP